MSSYQKTLIFRGSCPHCGVFQSIEDERCINAGCLVIHQYMPPVCTSCGKVIE